MKAYYPTVNLLRGIAALLVCLFHFVSHSGRVGTLFNPESLVGHLGKFGVNGVFVFFVISGFVIPLSLAKGNFRLKQFHKFILKRFIRIEIPYLISIFLVLLIALLFAVKNHQVYDLNIERFLFHIVYYIPFSDYEWYNVIYWTLAIEFQFYIVIGLMYVFLKSKSDVGLYLTLLIFALVGFFVDDNRFVFHYSTIFMQGIILYLMKMNRIKSMIGSFLVLACLISTAFLHSVEISIFCILTVIAIQYLEINTKATNWLGEISYSLYLTHGLIGGNILYFFSPNVTGTLGKTVLVIAALGASFLFSYLFWRIVEHPSKRLAGKINSN